MRGLLLLTLFSVALAGCGKIESASMHIQGPDHSLTLEREKTYAFSSSWDISLVVARMPDCQRRHHLKPTGDGSFKMEVYRTDTGAWILHQGKRWYVAETQNCQLQKYETKPPEPGTYVGIFEDKGGVLKFTQSPDLKKPAAPAEEPQK